MSDECFRPSVSASSDIDNQEIFDYDDDEEEEDDEPGLVLRPFRRVESEELIQHPAASSQVWDFYFLGSVRQEEGPPF